MGFYNEDGITKFRPDDTENKIYVESGHYTLLSAFGLARAKWHNIGMDDVTINVEHIQTQCYGYPDYDPSDYTDYIVLERVQS